MKYVKLTVNMTLDEIGKSKLRDKKANFTRALLLDSAIELLQEYAISDLSFKQISENAGVSERTMFRYFESRAQFLDELTVKMYALLQVPTIPDDSQQLFVYLEALYRQFEQNPKLVEMLLASDFLSRILQTTAHNRFLEIKALLIRDYPHCPEDLITMTAANLRYIMSATSWRYYRANFGFDPATSIKSASILVQQSLSLLDHI